MITKLLITLGMVLALFAVPAPAQAADCSLSGSVCGHFTHYAPDDGYDPSIVITCNLAFPVKRYVPEGSSSRDYCQDTDAIYIRYNEEMWCYMPKWYLPGVYSWEKKLDATGWHQIGDTFYDGAGCTLRTD